MAGRDLQDFFGLLGGEGRVRDQQFRGVSQRDLEGTDRLLGTTHAFIRLGFDRAAVE
jgi:hypothetical protein